jgi:hypothetical protein
MNRRLILLTGFAIVMQAAMAQAFTPPENMSLAPWAEPVQSTCIACSDKCDKCAKAGTSPGYTVDSCKKDCAAAGNPLVNEACGVRKRC